MYLYVNATTLSKIEMVTIDLFIITNATYKLPLQQVCINILYIYYYLHKQQKAGMPLSNCSSYN